MIPANTDEFLMSAEDNALNNEEDHEQLIGGETDKCLFITRAQRT